MLYEVITNGLRVVSVPLPHHHGVEVLFYLGVGSRHEPPGQAGVSHFLEHMLFKGTSEYPSGLDLERAFEAVGGSANAAVITSYSIHYTKLYEVGASRPRRPGPNPGMNSGVSPCAPAPGQP